MDPESIHNPNASGRLSSTHAFPVIFSTLPPLDQPDLVLDAPMPVHHFPSMIEFARFKYDNPAIVVRSKEYGRTRKGFSNKGIIKLNDSGRYFARILDGDDIKFLPASPTNAHAIFQNEQISTTPVPTTGDLSYYPRVNEATKHWLARQQGRAAADVQGQDNHAHQADQDADSPDPPAQQPPAPQETDPSTSSSRPSKRGMPFVEGDQGESTAAAPAHAGPPALPPKRPRYSANAAEGEAPAPTARVISPRRRMSSLLYRAACNKIPVDTSALDQLGQLVLQACEYCGAESTVEKVNGPDRLVPDGPYCLDNVVTACAVCNLARRDSSLNDLRALAARIAAQWESKADISLPPPSTKMVSGGVSSYLVDKNEVERQARYTELRAREARGEASCYICARRPADTPELRLGIDRKYNNHGYSPRNSRDCCWGCNVAKKDHEFDHFIAHMVRIHRHLANPTRWNALVTRFNHARDRIASGAFANLPIPTMPESRERVKPYYENRDGIAVMDMRGSEEGYIAAGPIMSVLAEELEVSANTLRTTTKVQGGRAIGPFRLVRVPSDVAWTLETMLDSAHQRVVFADVRNLWHWKGRVDFFNA